MRYGLFLLLFISLLLLSHSDVISQQGNEEQCASHTLHNKLLATDPAYAKQHKSFENQVQELVQAIQANSGNGAQAQIFGDTLEIPVVVHVIHTGQNVGVGANISTAQVNGAISALNDRYRKTPGTHGDAAGVDTEIQFVLAKRDPDCNSTTGIVRVNGSSVTDYSSEGITAGQGSGADELEVKALSRWPATDYMNVWVVTEIENNNGSFGIQGYAYFPGVSAVRDGIVIMHSAFGVSGTVNSWNNLNRTFTHEVGHYLDLYHTFEGDNSGGNCPGTTNGCGSGSGDCCADTEPHIRAASNCPTGTNTCTSASWDDVQHNYMNYSSQTCADMFTDDQSDRMRAALFGPRSSLLTSLGTEAPSSNTVASASCSPNTTNLSNGFGMGVTNLTFENIDVTSSSAVPDSGYRDYTCHQMAEVFPSTSYAISIKTGTANSEDVRVYIDFNDDGDFLDANEFVFTNDTDTLHTGTITIPSNPTLNTPLRMRIISDWQGNTAAMNTGESCYAPQYGQVEDYALLVKGSMTSTITGTDVSCNGGSDGSITVTVSSGTANYNYSWTNGASTNNSSSNSNTISGLAAGTYTVTVTDANSNTVVDSYTIGEPSSAVSASITINQMVSCFNGNDGQMTASGSGGSGSFSFAWMNGSTSATITGLTAGTYTVTVTDANGCTDSESATITGPSSGLSVSLTIDSNASCGSANGGLSATASGGTTAYTYAWSNSAATSSITGLAAGTYTVTVTDQNGCTTSGSASISQSASINISITVDSNASCGGSSTGGLTASASGGSGSLSYSWSNSASTASIIGLTAGTYTVTVTDSAGCTDTASQSISGGSSMTASISINSNVSCNGGFDGSLTASSTGGTNPITYAWNTSATTATITGLAAGTYTVTATDNGGCTSTATSTVTEPTAVVISVSANNVTCNGGNDGSLVATVFGGTPNYTFAWSTGATTQTIVSLSAGTYTVTVTDANGCSDVETGTITGPSSAVTASIALGTNISCNGGFDGSLTASATGGTASYSYSWVTGGTAATQTNLAAGTYTVTITDANGCTDEETFTLTEPSALVASASATNAGCSSSNGTASASASGGTLPYTFLWSIGSSSTTISSLSAGTYSVTATDANGCTDSTQVTVGSSGTGVNTSDTFSICNGDSIMVHGTMVGQTGTYIDTFALGGGCDSVSTIIVNEGAGSYAFVIDWIYQGDSIFLGGSFQTTSNIYLDTFSNNEGCDSIIETLLWIYPVQNGSDSLTICQGDSVLLGNVYRTAAGVYTDTTIVGGTAMINSTMLFVNTPQISTTNMNLNTGDSAFIAGSWRYVSGTYCDTIGACDSVNCVNLTIAPVTYVTFIDTVEICFGDSAFAGGMYQYNSGIYSDTVGNNSGVDTVFVTDLFVDPFNQVNLIYSSGLFLKSNQLNPPYQWFDCDSQTVIATTQVGFYLPGYSGNFSSINQASVCGDTSDCIFHSNTANKTSFAVNGYPTSARNEYTIDFDTPQKDIHIDLYDIHGQLIQSLDESEVTQITLPLGNVASGYYMVRIATLEGQRTLKFAKIID